MINKIESALDYVDAFNRETWLMAAMAIKSELGDDGFSLWDSWSQQADNYRQADAKAVWKGIKSSGNVGIGSLFYEAKANGWQYDGDYQKLSPLELAQRSALMRTNEEKAHRARLELQSKVADKAKLLWANAVLADAEHPYLIRKGVKPLGLRQSRLALLVPLSIDKQIINLQFIQPNGSKTFLTGGKVRGAYCAIAGNIESIYLCEGWATGATIRQLTGNAVACSMSAGNLLHAGLELRKHYPSARLIIAADNDRNSKENTGLNMAIHAAKRLNALLVAPEFTEQEAGSDFNDRYLLDQIKANGGLRHAS